jgi:hypothetical protein
MSRWLGIIGAVILTVATAQAWGPATHAYLVLKMPGGENVDLDTVFGAMHPDLGSVAFGQKEFASRLKRLTHYEFDRLPRGPFALGVTLHNGAWGADRFAHRYLHGKDPTKFPADKVAELCQALGIDQKQGEDLFEFTLDAALAIECGPELGQRITASAQASGKANEEALVDAYAAKLTEVVPGLTLAKAEESLRWSSRIHKTFLKAYGLQLARSEAYILRNTPMFLARFLGCNRQEADRYFRTALEICHGLRPQLDALAAELAESI